MGGEDVSSHTVGTAAGQSQGEGKGQGQGQGQSEGGESDIAEGQAKGVRLRVLV